MMRRQITNEITAGNLIVRTLINLVQGLIRTGPIKDLIWLLLSVNLSSSYRLQRR